MSLIRQNKAAHHDKAAQKIFNNLARASMNEAQRIVMHIFGYHITSISTLRELILDTMDYVQKGGIDKVTVPVKASPLDGLMISRFDDPDKNH